MSVIWSGITEEGAVVPVQVTEEGKVVAVSDGPQGDYLPLSGGNLTGDLTIDTNKITLSTDGSITGNSAELEGSVRTGPFDETLNKRGALVSSDGSVRVQRLLKDPDADIFRGYLGTDKNVEISASGFATFSGEVTVGGRALNGGAQGATLSNNGAVYASRENSGSVVFRGFTVGADSSTSEIFANGAASFSGNVIIGSRGSKWLIRESNGVAMLVEQTLRQDLTERVRDLPNELDMIEAALNEVMEKLKMVPPVGWPVWDGQDEVTSDNDNA